MNRNPSRVGIYVPSIIAAAVLVVPTTEIGAIGGVRNHGSHRPQTDSTTEPSTAVGVIAIGHSGLTGENSAPDRPGQDTLENSWATGTNPDVNSVYLRMIELRPDTEGRVANTAQGGAPASALVGQARSALAVVPAPELVIIQTIDSDIRCDGTDADHVDEFGADVAAVLGLITTESPQSRILIVGQLGRPRTDFVEELVAAHPETKEFLTGPAPCGFYDSDGNLVPRNFESLTEIIEGYEGEQARVCAAVPRCATDDGLRAAHVDELDNLSSDLNHLNVRGLAAAAEIAWPAVVDLLELDDAAMPTSLATN
jgi:hypothetical protein